MLGRSQVVGRANQVTVFRVVRDTELHTRESAGHGAGHAPLTQFARDRGVKIIETLRLRVTHG